MVERLQKILSKWGIASRRQAEQMILEGRVFLNGTVAELGQKADPKSDRIEVDGIQLRSNQRPALRYLLLNKPLEVVSTCQDPWGRLTVLDLLPTEVKRSTGIHPVGRLDADSTGALLLTNDGDVTFCMTHPRHSILKTYHVWVRNQPSESALNCWRSGVTLSGDRTLPAHVNVLRTVTDTSKTQTLLEIKIREGRNRQIRRVADLLGYPVLHLHRIAIGNIQLGDLPLGQYRDLSPDEINLLHGQVREHHQLGSHFPSNIQTCFPSPYSSISTKG